MLFIAMRDKPQPLRVNGEATVRDEDPLMAEIVAAQLIAASSRRQFSGLSALHPDHANSRAADLCAATWR
jgi:hypothetical protein